MAASVGLTVNTDGVFYIEMSRAIGISRGAVASITSISGMCGALIMPVTLRLYKKTSLKPVIFSGIACSALSCVGMMLSRSAFMLYFWASLRGFSITCYNSTLLTVLLTDWFVDRLGLISGIVFSASGLGGAVFNPIFSAIITASGVRAALLFRALVIVLLTLPGTVLFLHEKPREVGLEPYRSAVGEKKKLSPEGNDDFSQPVRLRSLCFVLLMSFYIFVQATSRVGDNLAGYADSLGMTPAQGAALASSLMVGNVVSKLFLGALNDRIGIVRAAMVGLVITTVSVLLLLLPGMGFGVLLGASFFSGTATAVATVSAVGLVRHVYGNRGFTAAMAVVSPFSALYALITGAYGLLYDLTGGYLATFALIIAVNLVSLAFLPFIAGQRSAA